MFKSLIVTAVLALSTVAQANSPAEILFASQKTAMQNVVAQGLNWAVGDENNYSITMGFIPGTMKMSVREISADRSEAWLVQDVNLMIQKQKIEALVDMNTGVTKKMLVDGKEQQLPASDAYEIIDQKEGTITVKAGTFKVMYVKIQDNGNNGQITEQWVNGLLIPVNGMAKSMSDSPLGKVTIELTSFKKN
ncbi:hypothetical protein CIK05_00565 [Bdellovibrio sp. qaytius]|nr:hypothetical protein CIK05_00565 [Bdellovibrio sp. qaytius]